MLINIWAVLVCGVIAMVVGFVWYGPLFGKNWSRIIGGDFENMTPEKQKEMQKRMAPVYLLNFILVILTVFILAITLNHFLAIGAGEGIKISTLMWLGFIMPTIAGSAMWSNKPRKVAWEMFLISASYQLVISVIFGAILGAWI